jgi:hypothetical protein
MKETTIRNVDGKPESIAFDGEAPVPLEAYVLLTKAKGRDEGHMLVFGGAEVLGRMLVNLFRWAVRRDPEAAYTLARAAEDILEIEKAARGRPFPDAEGPMTVQ